MSKRKIKHFIAGVTVGLLFLGIFIMMPVVVAGIIIVATFCGVCGLFAVEISEGWKE